MCTVTLVPMSNGAMRLAVNRDESRARPIALPPVVRQFGERQAILPHDPVGGGTWVAVSDAGLAFTLLNRNRPEDKRPRHVIERSRGLIIPSLLEADDLAAAPELTRRIDVGQYNPFRLMITDGHRAVELTSDGEHLDRVQWYEADVPLMFTSSGLGDQVVEGPRRQLFDKTFCGAAAKDWPRLQEVFQRHSWPDRLHQSVCMSRADARTVSLTAIDLLSDTVKLSYHGDAPDRPAELVAITLPKQESVLVSQSNNKD